MPLGTCAAGKSAICSCAQHMHLRAIRELRMPIRKKTKKKTKQRTTLGGIARGAMTAMVSASVIFGGPQAQGRTQKPALHGRHWMAVTGKPLGAVAGAKIFAQGGN